MKRPAKKTKTAEEKRLHSVYSIAWKKSRDLGDSPATRKRKASSARDSAKGST